MSKPKFLMMAALAASAPLTFYVAAQTTPTPVPTGAVAGHALMRVFMNGGVAEAAGYFPFVDGLGNNLFDGPASEKFARLTFRVPQFRVNQLANGKVLMLRPNALAIEGLAYNVYFDPSPKRDFQAPDTFSTGTLVGVYRGNSAGIVSIDGETLTYSATLTLEANSRDFTVGGVTANLARIAPVIQATMVGPAPTLDQIGGGSLISLPLGGSFSAAARRQ